MGQYIPVTPDNIESVTLPPFRTGKLALVCEGGGQRGIFTAGVLDEFQRAAFNPFALLLGTSAGAQNLSAYICGGQLIDLDWLVDITANEFPLAMAAGEKMFSSGREFYICACRNDDYSPGYFAPTAANWLNLIRASSAIPGMYRPGVELDCISYLDGGISDAIPVREAARRDADTIVVIRTVPSQMNWTSQWFRRLERWLGDNALQPLMNIMHLHEESYCQTQQFIENPPGELNIIEIFPPQVLASMALGSRVASLNKDYHLGRRCGRYFLATLGEKLRECGIQPEQSPAVVMANEPVQRVNAPGGWLKMILITMRGRRHESAFCRYALPL